MNFYGIDGDKVGSVIEGHLIDGDLEVRQTINRRAQSDNDAKAP